jgi:uncharacterized membrane protein
LLFRTFLFLATVSAGLFAGFCFCYAVTVTPALAHLDDEGYVTTMRRLNEAVPGVPFFLVIVGSVLWPLVAFAVDRPWHPGPRTWLIGAAALLGVAAFVVSMAVEVPLNGQLADAVTHTAAQYAHARQAFEKTWNAWHLVRTGCSVAATLLLVGAWAVPATAASTAPAARPTAHAAQPTR